MAGKRKILDVVVAALLIGSLAPAAPAGAIIGGQTVTLTRSWTVAFVNPADEEALPACGGVLVAPQWVLTSAACADPDILTDYKARIGSLDRTEGGTLASLSAAVKHPSYDEATGHNDIGLIKLAQRVSKLPAVLATGTDWEGTNLRLLGWGQTCPTKGCNQGSTSLKRLDTKVLTETTCRAEGLDFEPANELCLEATKTNSPDIRHTACYGDDGGPATRVLNNRVVGVISRGGKTCGVDADLIVTRVQPYLTWIKQQTG